MVLFEQGGSGRYAILAIVVGLGLTQLSAAQPPTIEMLSRNGVIRWDGGDAESSHYRIEWASSPEGPWRDSWSDLSDIVGDPRQPGASLEAQVPMFYRVVRLDGLNALPAAVEDSDFYDDGQPSSEKVELGKLLFFDKILSGNLNISCATCHHPLAATGDGLSLPVGEGGRGLGVTRDTGRDEQAVAERVPRNAPHIFNLGAKEFRRMFHDGRVETDPDEPGGFRSPAGDDLPPGFDNVLAVQAMFPVTSGTEMAGQGSENRVGELAAAKDLTAVWEELAVRLRQIPEYVQRFKEVYSGIGSAADITYVHAANAIAAFEAVAGRADQSPFDRFLRGENGALSRSARRGMEVFYGKALCADCHGGKFQTDQEFHCIAMPQVGPGKGDGETTHDDFGRGRETDDEDRYRFRTPSLRNVALTGPWGHDGAFDSLEAVVLHHLDPLNSLYSYDGTQAVLPARDDLDEKDFVLADDVETLDALAAACELDPVQLTDDEFSDLMAFLHALTDPTSIDLRAHVPRRVPSGLSLAE